MCVSAFVCPCAPWQCLLLHLPDSPKEGKTWKDALSICSTFGSSLVTIEDEIEQGEHKKNKNKKKTFTTFLLTRPPPNPPPPVQLL